MKGLTNYRITTRERIKDIKESVKVDQTLIDHYTFILEQYDSVIEKLDNEIAKLQDEKAHILQQLIKAPEELRALAKHLNELAEKRKNVTDNDKKVKRLKSLRDRLNAVTEQLENEGIDIKEAEERLDEFNKAEAAAKAAAEIAKDQLIAEAEAAARKAEGIEI